MKTSERKCVAQGELQPGDETLEAPISLTPEQLEAVAAGSLFPPGTIFGLIIRNNLLTSVPTPLTIHGVIPLRWKF